MIPVIEIYGPVIEGEGAWAGKQVIFLRLGGCDYRCSWCDSMFAVDPDQVKINATFMQEEQILIKVLQLCNQTGVYNLCISGGNPVIHKLHWLIDMLISNKVKINVETQGSVTQTWLRNIDLLTVSPKPPSSGMKTDWNKLRDVLLGTQGKVCIKVVIFTNDDLTYAQEVHTRLKSVVGPDRISWYLQPGTELAIKDLNKSVTRTLAMFKNICEGVTNDPKFSHWHVMPQLHALIFGQERRK